MAEIDLTEVRASLEVGQSSASIIEPGSPEAAQVRAPWQPIAQSNDPESRRLRALALWNREFLDLIPQYAERLRTKLLDVRVCTLSDQGTILLYLFSETLPAASLMVGWNPDDFGATEPIFWDTIPAPARTFLRHTHAGYTNNEDWRGGGPIRPAEMTTPAKFWDVPDEIADSAVHHWLDCEPIDLRRMLCVAIPSSSYLLCTTPDLPAGKGLVYYQNQTDIVDFFEELDEIMRAWADRWEFAG